MSALESPAEGPQQIIADLQRRLDASIAQQAATAEVMQLINASPSDLGPVFNAIVDKAMHLCDAGFGGLWVVDGDMARARATRNLPEAYSEFLTRQPLPQAEAFGNNPKDRPFLHVADLTETKSYRRRVPITVASVELGLIRTYLAVPLREGGALAGVISLYRKDVRPFTERQIALVQGFAAQAEIAMKNARLFNETREALERQTATADILRVIASSPSDVQPVFDAVAERAMSLLECWSVLVTRFDGEHVHFGAARGALPDTEKLVRQRYPLRPNRETSLLGRSLLERTVVSSPDVQAEADPQLRDYARMRGFHGELVVPLLRDDKVEGALVLTRAEPGPFTQREIALVQTFADQAVIAIQNVRMFTEVQARTRDLSEALDQQTATANVLKVISRSAFDLQAVFDTLISSAVELSGALNGTICLRHGDGYRYLATAGIQSDFAKWLADHPPTPGPDSGAGRVLLSGQVVCIPDMLEDLDYGVPAVILNKTRSLLGVPLLREDRVEGALMLARAEPGNFTTRQIELVQTFADQAVIAVENVRLFDEVQARTRELAASLDDLRAAQDRLVQTEKLASLGQLTAGIAHEIKNPLNFVNNFSAMSAELTDELNDVLTSAALTDKIRKEVDELTGMLKSNLEKVVQHGRRADSIVKNMLLHSREGSGERRPADINAIVEESLNLAYHGARAEKTGFNITLQRDFDPGAGELDIFPQEITRVFLNLISNGFYATAKRKAEAGNGYEPVLRATTKNLGNKVEIRIRDNGTGIPPEVKEKMFNPFFTTKPAGEGTGLGLSMSHDIVVKQHGGSIDVETEPGVFTEFRIVLPRTSQR
jgi:two-component system, NtrC family, sensor kinase